MPKGGCGNHCEITTKNNWTRWLADLLTINKKLKQVLWTKLNVLKYVKFNLFWQTCCQFIGRERSVKSKSSHFFFENVFLKASLLL